jgi:hypothetical protein
MAYSRDGGRGKGGGLSDTTAGTPLCRVYRG